MTSTSSRCTGLALIGLALAISAAKAATFNVTNPADFQSALTTAQSNGQNDTINVDVCSGAGCNGSVYAITTPLTYTASSGESFSLTIDGFDSDTRILDGGGVSTILRIDNTEGTLVAVRNMTLRNGNASGTGTDAAADGGALYILGGTGNIEVTGSVYENNVANDDGGAVFIRTDAMAEALVRIDDMTFQSNSALGAAGDGSGDGGAVHVATNPAISIDIDNIDFIANDAAGDGGALEVEGLDPTAEFPTPAGPIDVFDAGFIENVATGNGGGAAFRSGSINLERIGFVDNEGTRGGGLYVSGDLFEGTLANVGFARNSASENGGGFAIDRREGSDIIVIHNTLWDNVATNDGGGMWIDLFGSTGRVRAYNNIIYGNFAEVGQDVFIENDPFNDIPAEVTFSHNDITDLTGFPDTSTAFFIANATSLTETGNIDDLPILPNIDNLDPDPSQGSGSPTIDAGVNDPIANNFPPLDWEGDSRPQDGDGDGTATNDIGMDEFLAGALPSSDLIVTMADSPDPVVGGSDVTYSITVTSNGPDDASGVTVATTLDATVTFVSASFDQGTACTTSGMPAVVTCALGAMPVGTDAVGTVVVTTDEPTANTSVDATAVVSANEADPFPADNSITVSTTVVPPGPPVADLELSKVTAGELVFGFPYFVSGIELTYTLTVDNNGPDTATGVVVTDTLPGGVTFVSATTSVGTDCTGPDTGGVITCELGDLAATNNATVTVVVLPDIVTTETELTNTATVSANEDDPVPGNNVATDTATIGPPISDMLVEVTTTPTDPLVGDTVTYTVQVTNGGPSDDTGVFLEVTLPAGITLGDITTSRGSCDVSGDIVTCDFGDLADGETITVTVTVTAPSETGTILFEATVGGDFADPTATNNSVSQQLDVIDAIDIRVKGVGGSGSIGPYGLALLFAAAAAAWRCRRRYAGGVAPLATIAALTIGFSAPSAEAQSDWYAGASVGQADAGYSAGELASDLAARGWTISNPSSDDSDTFWKVYGGYEINELFSVEAGYADLGEVETGFDTSVPPNQIPALLADTVAVHPYLGDGWFAVGVLRWPLVPNQWSVSARAGVFAWEADIDVDVVQGATGSDTDKDTGTDAVYGLGIEWRANPQLSVTLEWERYRLNDWVDVPSLGIRWRF